MYECIDGCYSYECTGSDCPSETSFDAIKKSLNDSVPVVGCRDMESGNGYCYYEKTTVDGVIHVTVGCKNGTCDGSKCEETTADQTCCCVGHKCNPSGAAFLRPLGGWLMAMLAATFINAFRRY